MHTVTGMLGTETMTSKKGFRKAEGDLLRAAAGAAVLIVTAACATLWAGSAMAPPTLSH